MNRTWAAAQSRAWSPRNFAAGGSVGGGRRAGEEQGLVTLEWLLIVAAAAGIAALSTVTVQRVLDDTSKVPADPAVRLIDADIEAAFAAHEAQAAFEADPGRYDDDGFSARCDAIATDFSDVVEKAVWIRPSGEGTAGTAKCRVRPRGGLG